jgi:hypothetical protein
VGDSPAGGFAIQVLAGEETSVDVSTLGATWRAGRRSGRSIRGGGLIPGRLVFIYETWAKTNMTRSHGRCRCGDRLVAKVPAWALAHAHLPGSSALGPHRGAVRNRWPDQRPQLPGLCRADARPDPPARRCRPLGQSGQPQTAGGPPRHLAAHRTQIVSKDEPMAYSSRRCAVREVAALIEAVLP